MSWIILTLLTASLYAAECSLYELQGDVEQKDTVVGLMVNKDTNSQRVFTFSREIEFEMGPYIAKTVKGRFITRELEVLKIEEVKPTVPDPLYRHKEMVKLKTVPCPVTKKKRP